MPKLVPPQTLQKVKDLGLSGTSVGEIERQTGVTRPTIRRILDSVGVRPRPRSHSEEKRARIIEMYTAGVGCRSIAREMDISSSSVLVTLKRANVARRPLPTQHNALKGLPLVEIADRHLQNGESLIDLAAEFGVSYAGLRERLTKDGLIPKQSRREVAVFEFIQTWQEATSVTEVAKRLGITNVQASASAAHYRSRGIPLKRFYATHDWNALAEFAQLFEQE